MADRGYRDEEAYDAVEAVAFALVGLAVVLLVIGCVLGLWLDWWLL